MTATTTIVHITQREAWEQARQTGVYRADSLETEGFIHCSTPQQVIRVANAFYAGQSGLVLLCIDPARLHAPLRYEPGVGGMPGEGQELFPHLYGALNSDAVVAALEFPPDEQGNFALPDALQAGGD